VRVREALQQLNCEALVPTPVEGVRLLSVLNSSIQKMKYQAELRTQNKAFITGPPQTILAIQVTSPVLRGAKLSFIKRVNELVLSY